MNKKYIRMGSDFSRAHVYSERVSVFEDKKNC